jgi:hypothetical protein
MKESESELLCTDATLFPVDFVTFDVYRRKIRSVRRYLLLVVKYFNSKDRYICVFQKWRPWELDFAVENLKEWRVEQETSIKFVFRCGFFFCLLWLFMNYPVACVYICIQYCETDVLHGGNSKWLVISQCKLAAQPGALITFLVKKLPFFF